ncbi:MAG: MBL fold metallo-hydrolase [Rhodospirillales bacterium]
MKITVLGSGGASGVPSIEWGWGYCDPANPKNRRQRPSILVEEGERKLLVDTSPDLHWQLLDNDIRHLDAVLYTHAHADHLHGIDDLRAVNRVMKTDIPIYGDTATLGEISARFAYCIGSQEAGKTIYAKPRLVPHEIRAGEAFEVAGISVQSFDQDHGYMRSIGYRFGSMAYSTDLVNLPEDGFAALAGVDTWLVSALMTLAHPTHAKLATVLEWIDRLKPRRTILTHLSGVFDYEALRRDLPPGIEPAYDGMVVEAYGEPEPIPVWA